MERLETCTISPFNLFSVLSNNSFDQFVANWPQIQQRVPPMPTIDFLRKAAERRSTAHNSTNGTPISANTQKRHSVHTASHAYNRGVKRSCDVGRTRDGTTSMRFSSDAVDSAPMTDSEFARLLVLFRYNVTIREQYLPSMHSVIDANTSGMDSRLSFWTRVVEPCFNCEMIQTQVVLPSYVCGTIDVTAKPTCWRSGGVLRSEWLKFCEQFGRMYREYECCSVRCGFEEYCRGRNMDLNCSTGKRVLICGFLAGIGTREADERLLQMLECNGNMASDAVSQVGFSGERRRVVTESENDAPTSLNSTDYQDITRNMYNLLNVLKDRVSQSMSEESEWGRGGDIVKVIEQKESLLFALTRAKQKADEACTADLKSLWVQHAEDIHKMLSVLSTKQ